MPSVYLEKLSFQLVGKAAKAHNLKRYTPEISDDFTALTKYLKAIQFTVFPDDIVERFTVFPDDIVERFTVFPDDIVERLSSSTDDIVERFLA